MERSDEELKALRPKLNLPDTGFGQSIEHFQNQVLRPILKMQHSLLLAILRDTPHFKTSMAMAKDREDHLRLTLHWLQENPLIRQRLIGTVLGVCSMEEYEEYLPQAKEYDKRIVAMLAQRVTDTHWGPRGR